MFLVFVGSVYYKLGIFFDLCNLDLGSSGFFWRFKSSCKPLFFPSINFRLRLPWAKLMRKQAIE